MKRLIILGLILLWAGVAESADIQRGKTFTSTEEVTNTKLHNLVDDATITDIDQGDMATNYGTVFRSGTAPSDTDALWYDTGNTILKAYTGSTWAAVPSADPSFTTITTTGAGTIGGTLDVTGVTTLSSNLTVGGDSTVSGHLFAPDQLGAWSSISESTNYQASSDGFVVVHCTGAGNTIDIKILSDASTPPTVERASVVTDNDTNSGNDFFAMSPVKKDDYYRVNISNEASDSIFWIPLD